MACDITRAPWVRFQQQLPCSWLCVNEPQPAAKIMLRGPKKLKWGLLSTWFYSGGEAQPSSSDRHCNASTGAGRSLKSFREEPRRKKKNIIFFSARKNLFIFLRRPSFFGFDSKQVRSLLELDLKQVLRGLIKVALLHLDGCPLLSLWTFGFRLFESRRQSHQIKSNFKCTWALAYMMTDIDHERICMQGIYPPWDPVLEMFIRW